MATRKIIDSFIFYNEIEMLKYRISILFEIVDYFIITEATHTFSGKSKPLFFKDNRERFNPYIDKIIHVVVNTLNDGIDEEDIGTAWKRERTQRNSIADGYTKIELKEDDLILLSDLDEIPDPQTLGNLRDSDIKGVYRLDMDMYYYNLECKGISMSPAVIFDYETYVNMGFPLETIRSIKVEKEKIIKNGGWRLSYFGDIDFIKNKIRNLSHQELNNDKYLDSEKIQKQIDKCDDLFFRNNKITHDFRKHYIFDNEYLPPHYQRIKGDVGTNGELHILFGHYNKQNDRSKYIDVTERCIEMYLCADKLMFPANKSFIDLFGDPMPQYHKKLVIRRGDKYFKIWENNKTLIQINLNTNRIPNKNIIYICSREGRLWFDHHIKSLNIIDVEIYYDDVTDLKDLEFHRTENIFIFRYHVPSFVFPQDNIYVLNTEQTTNPTIFAYLDYIRARGYKIIDYSMSNIYNLPEAIHLPCQPDSTLRKTSGTQRVPLFQGPLKGPAEIRSDDIYDVGIINQITERSRYISDKLKSFGLKIVDVQGFDITRDHIITSCKIVLNIHPHNGQNIFEHIRCDRWIFENKVIVSEDVMCRDQLDIKDFIHWAPYDKLVDLVIDLFNNKKELPNTKILIEQRINSLNNIIDIFNEEPTTRYSFGIRIPIIIVCYNNWKYVNNMVKQIEEINPRYVRDLMIINNSSTDYDTITYLKRQPYPVLTRPNIGPWIHPNNNADIYDKLPNKFILTDPDLQLNKEIPKNFIEHLLAISDRYKLCKVGFAMSLENYETKMFHGIYYKSYNLYESELYHWSNKVDDPLYDLYDGDIDTTFALMDKRYNGGRCYRVGGNFTCYHLPWYTDDTVYTVYERWKLLSTSETSTINRLFVPYIKQNYYVVNKNDINLLIPYVEDPFDPSLNKSKNNDPNLEFWINEFPKWKQNTYKIFDQTLSSDKMMIDIGGWIGATCIYGSRKSKHVYVVEADPQSVKDLKLHCKINCSNVTVIDKLIYHQDDVEMDVSRNRFKRSGKWKDSTNQILTDVNRSIKMKTVTIDHIIYQYNIDLSQISLINVNIGGDEQFLLDRFYHLKVQHPHIHLYISFHYDRWDNEDLSSYKLLSEKDRKMIIDDPSCSILF